MLSLFLPLRKSMSRPKAEAIAAHPNQAKRIGMHYGEEWKHKASGRVNQSGEKQDVDGERRKSNGHGAFRIPCE